MGDPCSTAIGALDGPGASAQSRHQHDDKFHLPIINRLGALIDNSCIRVGATRAREPVDTFVEKTENPIDVSAAH